jgi:opacity protein-like surface antigen
MKRLLALPILLALPLVAAAQPDEIQYLYVDLSYGTSDTDLPGGSVDADGLSLEVSVPVRDSLYLVGGISASELEDDADASSTERYFGLGAHYDFSSTLSVYGQAGFIDLDLDVGAGNLEDDGLFVSGGVRYMPSAGWEVRGGVDYVDLDVVDSDTSVFVATDLFLTDVVTLTLRLSGNDDTTQINLGGRFYFGNDSAR